MKIKIEIVEELEEEEVIIRCATMNSTIQKVQQAIQNVTSKIKKITFLKGDTQYYLPLDTILFFETSDNVISAHTISDVYQIKNRLYELEEILPRNFLRVSKSTILNIDSILSVERNLTSSHIIKFYQSHKQVYVSRYYFKDLRERLEERRNYES